jgi:glutamate-1-semialdehyde 2,1-aminomutase
MGVVPPAKGFLAQLRELATRHGALLIFDEVVTGFRLGPAGAQGRFGVQADLTTFGKVIGGGMPIGAVAGPARLMDRLAPEGDVYHGGTFAGHPLSMAAGAATLNALLAHPPYDRLDQLAEQAADGVRRAARAVGIEVQVNQISSMFTVFFSGSPVRNLAEAQAADRTRFAQWANFLRRRGILVPPSPMEAAFVSAAHTPAHIARLIAASRAAFAALDA